MAYKMKPTVFEAIVFVLAVLLVLKLFNVI